MRSPARPPRCATASNVLRPAPGISLAELEQRAQIIVREHRSGIELAAQRAKRLPARVERGQVARAAGVQLAPVRPTAVRDLDFAVPEAP